MVRLRTGGALAFGIMILVATGCGSQPQPTAEPPPPPLPATEPLKVGDLLPPIPVAGWLHDPPPTPGTPGVRLLLVDVWSSWCPYCRDSAPGLVRLHRQYADRGVRFVSVTDMPREVAEAFSQQLSVPWPSGYGLTRDGIVALRACSGMTGAWYEVAPVVYLVGPDGRVRGTDRQGRYHHFSPGKWERELGAAIEAALDGP